MAEPVQPEPIAELAPIAEAVHIVEPSPAQNEQPLLLGNDFDIAVEVEVETEASNFEELPRVEIDAATLAEPSPNIQAAPMAEAVSVIVPAQNAEPSPDRNEKIFLRGVDFDIALEFDVETEASNVNELPRAKIDAAAAAEPPPNTQATPMAEALSIIVPAQNAEASPGRNEQQSSRVSAHNLGVALEIAVATASNVDDLHHDEQAENDFLLAQALQTIYAEEDQEQVHLEQVHLEQVRERLDRPKRNTKKSKQYNYVALTCVVCQQKDVLSAEATDCYICEKCKKKHGIEDK